jgi:hypothetical protein
MRIIVWPLVRYETVTIIIEESVLFVLKVWENRITY